MEHLARAKRARRFPKRAKRAWEGSRGRRPRLAGARARPRAGARERQRARGKARAPEASERSERAPLVLNIWFQNGFKARAKIFLGDFRGEGSRRFLLIFQGKWTTRLRIIIRRQGKKLSTSMSAIPRLHVCYATPRCLLSHAWGYTPPARLGVSATHKRSDGLATYGR